MHLPPNQMGKQSWDETADARGISASQSYDGSLFLLGEAVAVEAGGFAGGHDESGDKRQHSRDNRTFIIPEPCFRSDIEDIVDQTSEGQPRLPAQWDMGYVFKPTTVEKYCGSLSEAKTPTL